MLRSRVFWKLYGGFVVLVLSTAAIVGVLITRRVESNELRATEARLRSAADLLTDVVANSNPARYQERVQILRGKLGVRFTIVDAGGAVLADSDEDPARMSDHAARSEIAAARGAQAGVATRLSATQGRRMMYVALPVRKGDALVGYARAAIPLAELDLLLANVRALVAAGALFGVTLAAVVGFFFARRFVLPLAQMTRLADAVASGDYRLRVPPADDDEFGALARSLNSMAQRIETDIAERERAEAALKRAHDELERRVEERTAELRSREERLRQAQKMEAVGQLAGGVAHDFNNLLTVITGYTQMLLRRPVFARAEDSDRRKLEQIYEAAERAAALTSQLLAFSRKQMLQPRVVDLNETIADTDKMLRRLIGEDISFVTRAGADLGRVLADPNQLTQVLVNLCVNARDAMPAGGTLTIETRDVELDHAPDFVPDEEAGVAVKPGAYVCLLVSDTGAGIDRQTRARIFEPFFTTKEQGKGTGLGLSTVYGIVKQSGGYIWVDSEPSRGTTFRIYLPRVEAEADPRREPETGDAPGGAETVLVVEDEEIVRGVTVETLRAHGYQVLEAADAGEALRIERDHREEIDLLVTDVVMPGMSGRELAAELAARRPATPVLYVSGYTDRDVVRRRIIEDGAAFLQKPFTPAALACKAREVLDGARARAPRPEEAPRVAPAA